MSSAQAHAVEPSLDIEELPGALVVAASRAGNEVVLELAGEADLATSALLRQQLGVALAALPSSLVVDVTDLTFCDLSGLDVLNEATRAAQFLGVTVSLRGMSPMLAWLCGSFPAVDAVPVGVNGR